MRTSERTGGREEDPNEVPPFIPKVVVLHPHFLELVCVVEGGGGGCCTDFMPTGQGRSSKEKGKCEHTVSGEKLGAQL